MSSSESKWHSSRTETTSLIFNKDALRNGDSATGIMVEAHGVSGGGKYANTVGDQVEMGPDCMSEISNSDLSLPEVCVSTNNGSFEEDMNYEVQQAYRIFTGFLLDKYKGITGSFVLPVGHLEAQRGIGGVGGRGLARLRQSMCIQTIEEKFVGQQYDSITEFVADFRLMLENCYRYHGVDHWLSKQAQKLEVMLEQKLTLLSRTLREKTTLAVTSKGRFGVEEERNSGGTSTRRRSAPRSLTTITVGGHESLMVQSLRQEELQRVKDEKRQRELEKKEAEETSAKELEEWEQSLLSQALPHPLDTLWELPAIGHFLCLAQTALNLPEIVFFELERSLLMPRCSLFLSKVMSSLLCAPQKRPTVHRQPPLPYRRWERELRQRVLAWYRATGASDDQPGRAEQLGLCHQFFCVLGKASPLEELPFHLLPFYQRVWLLKGLCDHVYETQKEVQDAVLAQPIHECRESILGYDGVENAYIHFPHFCGADLRIYFQSPCTPPAFPFPALWAWKVDVKLEAERGATDGEDGKGTGCYDVSMVTGEFEDEEGEEEEKHAHFKRENGGGEGKHERLTLSSLKGADSDSGSFEDAWTSVDSESNLKAHANSSRARLKNSAGDGVDEVHSKQNSERWSKRVKQEPGLPGDSGRTIKAETHEPCLSVGEHCYMGRSPVSSLNLASPPRPTDVKTQGGPSTPLGQQAPSSCSECSISSSVKSGRHKCRCSAANAAAATPSSFSSSSSESVQNLSEENTTDAITGTRKRKRKKKRERVQPAGTRERRRLQSLERPRYCRTRSAKTTTKQAEPSIPQKGKRSTAKTGKKLETSSNETKQEPLVESPFKLVCSSIEELRELISRTEDQLDSLQSDKKRSGRWYLKKESVKDLHITLIRLLNELSPWEPKLVKAFQRNRLRMKKECDDFRKHPDYSNFVREECVSSSSSSSSSLDQEEGISGRVTCDLSDHYREPEEEDMEHAVPRGFWTRGNPTQLGTEAAGEDVVIYGTSSHPKPLLRNTDEDFKLCRGHTLNVDPCLTSPSNTGLESRSEQDSGAQTRDLNSVLVTPAPVSLRARVPILHPTIGLPWGYTPIPTLFAKSVGNKVTLMKRPADYLCPASIIAKTQRCVGSMPPSLKTTAKSPALQTPPPPHPHRTVHSTHPEPSEQRKTNKHLVASTATASLAKAPPAKPTQMAVPKSPVKVVYRVTEGLDHVLRQDGTGQVKLTVQPLMDQKTGEKIMNQVVILPSKLLLQNNEKVSFMYHPQSSKSIQAPVSKTASPLCTSTSMTGFRIPEGQIPVQQVAPLKETRTTQHTPSPSGVSCLQQNTVTTTNRKVARVCSLQSASQIQSLMPTSSSILANAEGAKAPKQELKTVCIRDSQSILVTTRGGNTGIVKVQTLAEQSAHGSSPASPVITISPQFKAFLVSKGSPPVSTSSSSPTMSVTVPAPMGASAARSPFVSMSPVTCATPLLTTASSIASPAGAAASVGHSISAASNLPTMGPRAVKTVNSQTSLVKSNMIMPSLRTGTPTAPTQETLMSKPGLKRPSTEERTQLTKFILMSPSSSCPSSNAALPKLTSPLPTPPPGSRILFIGEPAAMSPDTTHIGGIPKQVPALGIPQPTVATSCSGEGMKTVLALGQHLGNVKSESLSNLKNFTLPSDVAINHPGQMKPFGQTIDTVLQSPSKSTPGTTSTGHLLKASTLVPGSPIPPAASMTTSSSLIETPSVAVPHRGTSRCTSTVPSSTGYILANNLAPNLCAPLFDKSPLGALNVHPNLANPTTCSMANQPRHVIPPVGSAPHQFKPSTQPPSSVPHQSTSTSNIPNNSVSTNTLPVTAPNPSTISTAAAGPVQQRIVINTSTHLAAGTQILLNNARFVVPPQGLGPGSHVLIISGQAPSTGNLPSPTAAPPTGLRPVSAAPRLTALPISPHPRIPSVPALRSPVAVRTPIVGLPVLPTVPNATPVRFVGAQSLSSSLMPNVTKLVTVLPQLQGSRGLSSPVAGTSALVTSPIRLDCKPALVFSTKTIASVPGIPPPAVRLSAGTTKSAPVATPFPQPNTTHLHATTTLPVSSLLTAGTSSVSIPCTSTDPIASVASVVAQSPAGIPLLASTPTTVDPTLVAIHGLPVHMRAFGIPATFSPASTIPQVILPTGPNALPTGPNALQTGPHQSVKPQLTMLQPQQPDHRTQAVPTVAVSPIVSTVSRIQS
ncbi:uncharacterized protein KIAA2026 isoform X2 [Gadus chalcogrammus]|uniref:uncharacterized protein KIAA2026 isoform X2 n=1 Tax=Gadus chalcogrammus TaxID=1042646 RepID=UPI0024C28E6C|nr:uncharacterized protein KIAA2026 isoform X2 [Gadus chalcogrammus]